MGAATGLYLAAAMTSIASTSSSSSSLWGAHLRLLGMALLWGCSWPAGRIVVQHMSPLAASAVRFLLALLVLLPWLYFSGSYRDLRRWDTRRWAGMALAGAVGVFGYAWFFLGGLQHLPAGKAALIITLNPVITLLLAVLLFKERLNRTIAAGMVLAALGAVVVISHGDPLQVISGGMGVGELMILGCVACWVSYTLLGRWLLQGVDALAATTITSLAGAVLLLLGSWILEGSAALAGTVHAGAQAWGALCLMAFGSTALAYAWYFDGLKALGAGAASGYITLVPIVGVACSAWWLGEDVDAALAIGGAMAVLGTAVMNWGRRSAA